jgi:hypothetical protein
MHIGTKLLAFAVLAIGFMATSCRKQEQQEITPTPTISMRLEKVSEMEVRLANPAFQLQIAMLPPRIDSVYINEVTRTKIQLLLRFYWANDIMSYMQMQIRPKGSTAAPTCSPWTPINGPGFWQVFQDNNNLVPGTDYEILIVAYNSHGSLPSRLYYVTTLP